VVGDPTEGALLSAAAKAWLRQAEVNADLPRYAEIPFESGRKRMTTVHRLAGGGARVICKGAPEAMISGIMLADDPGVQRRASERAEEYARNGFRVLAVATADLPAHLTPEAVTADLPAHLTPEAVTADLPAAALGAGPPPTGQDITGPPPTGPRMARAGDGGPANAGTVTASELERGLRLLGLIAILDPPRPSAAATIAACHAAGITTVLITGDHPATARSIATELGIIEPDGQVVDCRDHPDGSAGDQAAARVFARATPEQKLAIIQARRAAGDVVAMTGDGVNDGPALRRADIGVAMGRRGTEVARQAADLVLADDELRTVVVAAEEGRRVYANIRRFLLYALSGGSAEIAVMLAGPLLGLPLPLLPAQILWVNLLTHGLPGVALGSEPADPAVMRQPPRPPAESVLGAGLWQRIVRVGLVVAGVTLGVAVWGHATGRPWQSLAFFALGATQLAVALGSRSRPGTLANPLLPVAVAVALLLQFAGLYVPFLRDLLGTQPLTLLDLAVACALSTLGYAAVRLDRVLFPSRRAAAPPPASQN
jgi:Ca2+-transporting ATPase